MLAVAGPNRVQRGTAFGLSYKYCSDNSAVCTTNNGNVMRQTISHAGDAEQVYTYDALGRLASAVEGTSWSRSYGADQWSNQWVTTGTPTPDAFTPRAGSNFDTNNRLQLQSAAYDGAGNQMQIGGYASTYDGEGRLATSTLNGVQTTHSYDGEGRRVKKATGTRTNLFTYGVSGELLEDYDTQTPTGQGTQYVAQDHLGSTRATFNTAGTAVKCSDYMPFGEELPANTGAGRSGPCWAASAEPKVKFGGKERDAETGLDYFLARYYSAAQGRFTSPDEWAGGIVDPFTGQQVGQPGPLPYADITDPQTLNKYAYVRNNPLRYTDPDGHVIDTLADIGFIAYDIYQIAKGGATTTNVLALGADVVGAVVPFATGLGTAVRAGRAVEQGVHAAEAGVHLVEAGAHAAEAG